MGAGRPKRVDAGLLYGFAHLFYWDLKTVAEGAYRVYVDKPKLERLTQEAEATQLSEEQLAVLDQCVLEEIQTGRLPASDKAQRLHELTDNLLFDVKFAEHNTAADLSRKTVRIPGEPDIIAQLLSATKPEQIVEICKDAFTTRRVEIEPGVVREVRVPNWLISGGSELPMYLSKYATVLIEARNDPRFPKSMRPSTRLKQLWFVSRALAGAIFGVTTRTAINLVGSMRPDEMFHELRDGKPARKQRKAKQIATRRH
jgi:hypothetical protein